MVGQQTQVGKHFNNKIVTISIYNALLIGSGLVAVVLMCIKRG